MLAAVVMALGEAPLAVTIALFDMLLLMGSCFSVASQVYHPNVLDEYAAAAEAEGLGAPEPDPFGGAFSSHQPQPSSQPPSYQPQPSSQQQPGFAPQPQPGRPPHWSTEPRFAPRSVSVSQFGSPAQSGFAAQSGFGAQSGFPDLVVQSGFGAEFAPRRPAAQRSHQHSRGGDLESGSYY